jgi:hypothetical protein
MPGSAVLDPEYILRGCLRIIFYDEKWGFQILSHNEGIGVSAPRTDFSNIL